MITRRTFRQENEIGEEGISSNEQLSSSNEQCPQTTVIWQRCISDKGTDSTYRCRLRISIAWVYTDSGVYHACDGRWVMSSGAYRCKCRVFCGWPARWAVTKALTRFLYSIKYSRNLAPDRGQSRRIFVVHYNKPRVHVYVKWNKHRSHTHRPGDTPGERLEAGCLFRSDYTHVSIRSRMACPTEYFQFRIRLYTAVQ